MRDKIFVGVVCAFFIVMLLFAPSLRLLEAAGIVTTEKMGNIIAPSKVYEGTDVLSLTLGGIETAKAVVEDTYTNYLPWYAQIVTSAKNLKIHLNRGVNDLLSAIANPPSAGTIASAGTVTAPTDVLSAETETPEKTEPSEPVIVRHTSQYLTNSGGTNFYAIDATYSDGSEVRLITLALSTPETVWRERMEEQAELVNGIAAVCEELGVNVYFYACSRLQDGAYFADYVPGEPSLKPLVDEFFGLLDPYVRSGRLKVDTLEESIQKLFLTDHHWNADGMYEAYCDIVNLMREDTPSIAAPRALGERHFIDDAEFYGTNARTSGYYACSDVFWFYDYALPAHTLKATYAYSFEEKRNAYLAGNFDRGLSTDHYVNFYPYAEYLRYKNDTGRNVLVLGDSYSRGISELLASSFDKTYVFDYRRIHEIRRLRTYIEEHEITDVLFMQYSLRGIFNNQNDNTLQTIRVK